MRGARGCTAEREQARSGSPDEIDFDNLDLESTSHCAGARVAVGTHDQRTWLQILQDEFEFFRRLFRIERGAGGAARDGEKRSCHLWTVGQCQGDTVVAPNPLGMQRGRQRGDVTLQFAEGQGSATWCHNGHCARRKVGTIEHKLPYGASTGRYGDRKGFLTHFLPVRVAR